MKQFIRLTAVVVLFLVVGLSMSSAQEATFGTGPTIAPASGAANGGFFWGDINKDGFLDVWIPSNNILYSNSGNTFASAASTATANIVIQTNSVGGLLADFNGDGVLDLFTTNNATPATGLFYNVNGVYTLATGTGDLASAGVTGEVFQGSAAMTIDHSNYLSLVWPGTFTNLASNNSAPRGGAMWFLKGGASGFTNIAKGATAANLGIDTSLSFESWDVRPFDANNDGYVDLLMPSFRNLISKIDTGASGARKGCVLFLNDGTGKFYVPTGATLVPPRTLYTLDTAGVFVTHYKKDINNVDSAFAFDSVYVITNTRVDTGVIVDDTVRHFAAIGETWGDLNNDGIQDIVFNGLNANDNRDGNGNYVADVIVYGKGDGTFTYKWNGVNIVANNGLVQATNQRALDIGDYNNDGLADIYASGTFAAQHLYRNNGDGTFTDVAAANGLTAGGQRGGGLVDYNNDGFMDVYMYTGGNSIMQKNNTNTNKWVGFMPVGTGHNMSAVGTKFTVISNSPARKQVRVIKAEGGSAGSGSGLRANFGLGTGNVDTVIVNWPDGTSNKWSGTQLAAGDITVNNRYWTIQEGASIPPAPVTVRPSWVAKHDTALLATDTLNWNRVTGGNGAISYRVQVATNRTFATIVKDLTVTDSSTIVRLGLSTTYYWRVRGISAGYTGVWAADSFKTLFIPCTVVPQPLYPAAGITTVPIKPLLKVSYVSSASTYNIQVDTVNRFTTNLVLNDSVNILDTTYTFASNLKPSVKYYWRVRGWNAAGSSGFSPVDSFTIMYVPAVPVLAYPGHNQAQVSATSLKFKWNSVAGDSNYVVQSWTYTSNGQVLRNDTTKHDTTLTLTGLLNRQRYFWKVMTFNQGGASAFSAPDSFTTVIEVAAQVVLGSPRNTTGENRRTLFTWNPALNAESYHMQVAVTSAFAAADIKVDVMSTDTSELISDTLLASTTYYWRVSGINLGGEGPFSSVAHYTTGVQTSVDANESVIPKEFALMQNYPNPFNPTTNISYDIPNSAYVTLRIYDVLGRLVSTLVDGIQAPNSYKMQWNPAGLSSGVYFYRIQARSQDGTKNFTSVKKLVFMK